MTYLSDSARVCREVVADGVVARVCGPVGLQDVLVFTLGAFVVLLLLLPDLSEVGIPGLASLKRRVEANEEKTKQIEGLVLRQTIHQNLFLNTATAPNFPASEASAEAKARRIAEGEEVPLGPEPTGVRALSPERAVAEAQLIATWESLAELLGPLTEREFVRRAMPRLEGHPLQGWLTAFTRELQDFRAARNTVAHRPQNMTDEEVQTALVLGRTLLESLQQVVSELPRDSGART
jgi:hypothetical protein